MGHVLSDLGRPEEALAAYRDALRHKPDLPDLYNNMGLALRQAGRLEEAEVALRQAVKRAPRDAQAQGNLAGVLKELGRPAEAEACYRAALRGHPDDPVLHLNLGIVLLLVGRFDDGWEEYEWRFRAGAAHVPHVQPTALERRGPRGPHAADPRRAGHGRYHPVLPLRDAWRQRADRWCSRCSRACGI